MKYTASEYFKLIESSETLCELINGNIVDLASPSGIHQDIVGGLYTAIREYISSNKGKCRVYIAPFDVVLNDYNVVIPDISVICDTTKLDGKRCNGSPDWIVEVVSSNYLNDYRDKLELYKLSGVREYWIVDPSKERVFVYYFENPKVINIYRFDESIPVNIYADKPNRLEINVASAIVY
jgi:Uma2 family endonuclease